MLRVKREKGHPEKTRMLFGCGSQRAHRPAACGRSRPRFRVRSTGNDGGGDSNQNDLGRLARSGHARDEGGEWLVVPFGAEGTHIECAAQAFCPDAADLARPAHRRAGAMFARGQVDEGGECLGREIGDVKRSWPRFRPRSGWNASAGSSASRMVAETSPKPVMLRTRARFLLKSGSVAMRCRTSSITASIWLLSHSRWATIECATARQNPTSGD